MKLTQEKLRQLLEYDAVTGDLIWRYRDRSEFKAARSFNTFNAVYAGKIAGHVDSEWGYRRIGVFGRLYRAHRLVWLYLNGGMPQGEIDHINHDKIDNRIENLRCVSRSENERNKPLRKDNRSGVAGVHRHKDGWEALIGGRRLGHFLLKSDAVAARLAAEIEEGFHPNHGANPAQQRNAA